VAPAESEREHDRRDTWSPVRLARVGVELVVQAEGDGLLKKTLGRGRVKVVTKDGLVRVVDAEGHAGTLAQGRWGLLCAAQGAEAVAERLCSLVRDTEQEEAARGVPSLQLWTGLVKSFQVDGVSGSSLLVAPSCAPGVIRQPGDSMLHNTLTLSPSDQTNLLPALTPEGPWVCLRLTRATTATAALVERLEMVEVHVYTFKRCSLVVAERRNWRKGKLVTARSGQEWKLVVSKALAHCQVDVERTCVAVSSISLTKDGVVPLDPAVRPSRRRSLVLAGRC
jgi:hypothetical protein